ncbi:MAG: hypothetical protein EBS86_13710, partial [Crocinitomicaceae bacterium]|nr:hypothetical protein [Crocinitomicaceae bacterium]
ENEKILYVKCRDTYECLPMKTYLSICAITDLFPNVQYVLKTDDDMQCNISNFKKMITDIEGYDYGGEIVETNEYNSTYHYPNVEPHSRVPFRIKHTKYCPGRFYFLSKPVCEEIKNNELYFNNHIFEDYAIGYFVTRIPNVKCMNIKAKSIFYDN